MGAERTSKIEEVASAWLMHRDSGNWAEADQTRFEAWLGASIANRVAYLRLKRAWDDARRLKALGAGINNELPPAHGSWNLTPFFNQSEEWSGDEIRPSRIRSVRPAPFAFAASIGLALLLGGTYYLRSAGNAYETPVGGIASVPMPDGSRVTLNTDSQIRVSLTETERRIELKHGEAFFEVAKDPDRPFIVNVHNKRVIAVGTKFSVQRDGDDIEVIVTEGRVRVEDATVAPLRSSGTPAARIATIESKGGGSGEIIITPGSIAHATEAGVLVRTGTLLAAEEQLSWRTGVLVFRNQTLAAAAAEFNRYNTRKIVIEDAAIASLRIEGNFRSTNVDGFARLLEQGYAIRVTQLEERIALTAR